MAMEDPVTATGTTTWALDDNNDDDNVQSIDFGNNEQSIDFSKTAEAMINNHKHHHTNHCSAADTVSTAGESSSWGSSACCEYSYDDELSLEDLVAAAASSSSRSAPLHEAAPSELEQEVTAELESSLTLADIETFFLEDQVDPHRTPPPKARTVFEGDSQNSFTLDDLAKDDEDDETCLGPSRRRSRRRSSQQRQQQQQQGNERKPLKGILKNGSRTTASPQQHQQSAQQQETRRSTLLMMEDSAFLDLNTGSLEDFDFGDDSNDSNHNRNESHLEASHGNGWSLLQQSFSADCAALDFDYWQDQQQQSAASALVLEEEEEDKHVTFSTVHVHYHVCVVGDNPSVSEGVPLSLAWEAVQSITFASLEAYEQHHREQKQEKHKKTPPTLHKGKTTPTSPAPPPRFQHPPCLQRHRSTQMARTAPRRLDAEERMFLLLAAGVSLADIQHAERLANRTRDEREATKQQHLLLGGGIGGVLRAIETKEEDSSHDGDAYYEHDHPNSCASE